MINLSVRSDCAQNQHQFRYDSIEKWPRIAFKRQTDQITPKKKKKTEDKNPKTYDALLSTDYHVSQESVFNLEVLPLAINILQSYMIQIEGDCKKCTQNKNEMRKKSSKMARQK